MFSATRPTALAFNLLLGHVRIQVRRVNQAKNVYTGFDNAQQEK